jgi:regulator of sigma E protease
MDILIQGSQFLLSLSILVIFHEFGHFLAAKLFDTRVEKFYLFFNPFFSLFKFSFKGTEYGMGWLPLGGYVKISGMIDESMDKEQMKKPPQPHEFRSKPAWQRLIIMLGGVIVNILLAITIYIFMLYAWGEKYLPTSEVKYGITADSLALEMGLRNGDKILTIDHVYVDEFHKIPAHIIIEEARTIQVLRNDTQVNIEIPGGFLNKLVNHRSPDFIGFRFPFTAGKFAADAPALKAGFEIGDQFIAINGKPTPYFDVFRENIRQYKNQQVIISAIRDSDTIHKPVSITEEGIIGVNPQNPYDFFKLNEKHYTFLAAIPAGTVKAFDSVNNYLKQLRLLFSREVKAYESIGGFLTIGSIFPTYWDWRAFWHLTAFLSIMLAILNVLPIPALDGGHVMFLFYEIITRRKPSDKFMEYAQMVGMIFLIGLLIFANGNDILRYLGYR